MLQRAQALYKEEIFFKSILEFLVQQWVDIGLSLATIAATLGIQEETFADHLHLVNYDLILLFTQISEPTGSSHVPEMLL
jgi:hypothetical protein